MILILTKKHSVFQTHSEKRKTTSTTSSKKGRCQIWTVLSNFRVFPCCCLPVSSLISEVVPFDTTRRFHALPVQVHTCDSDVNSSPIRELNSSSTSMSSSFVLTTVDEEFRQMLWRVSTNFYRSTREFLPYFATTDFQIVIIFHSSNRRDDYLIFRRATTMECISRRRNWDFDFARMIRIFGCR